MNSVIFILVDKLIYMIMIMVAMQFACLFVARLSTYTVAIATCTYHEFFAIMGMRSN